MKSPGCGSASGGASHDGCGQESRGVDDGHVDLSGRIYHVYPSEPLPPFDDPRELTAVWGRPWGASDEISRLKVVLMRRPGVEFEAMTNGRFDEELGLLMDPAGHWYWRRHRAAELGASACPA